MGVPGLNRWLDDNIEGYQSTEKPAHIRLAMLDLNGSLHPWFQALPAETTDDEIIDIMLKNLEIILDFIKADEVYLAVDMVPSLAKIVQQRSRRYRADVEKMGIGRSPHTSGGKPNLKWNRNKLTPGTAVMIKIRAALDAWAKKTRKYKACLDSSQVDESEHQITAYLRKNSHLNDILILSDDMDYTMLLSVLDNKKMTIMRQNHKSKDEDHIVDFNIDYSYVSVDNLKIGIAKKIMRRTDTKRAIYDFVALMSVIGGNDFVAPSPELRFTGGATKNSTLRPIQDVFAFYHEESFNKNGDYLVQSDGKLNCQYMQRIMKRISESADKWLSKLNSIEYKKDSFLRDNKEYTVPLANFKKENYLRRWNHYKLECFTDDDVNKVVDSYMGIISWYVLLYIKGTDRRYLTGRDIDYGCSWRYYYPYGYAPLTASIAKHKNIIKFHTFDIITAPLSPIEQQLIAFSKESIKEIMSSKYYTFACEHKELYPDLDTIPHDYELIENIHNLHAVVLRLPLPRLDVIRRAIACLSQVAIM